MIEVEIFCTESKLPSGELLSTDGFKKSCIDPDAIIQIIELSPQYCFIAGPSIRGFVKANYSILSENIISRQRKYDHVKEMRKMTKIMDDRHGEI